MSERFDEVEHDTDDFNEQPHIESEVTLSKKLERRRKIEDLFEEKRLQEELRDFA